MEPIIPDTWFTLKDISIPGENDVHIFFINIESQSYDSVQYNDFYANFDNKLNTPNMSIEKKEKSIKREFFLRLILSKYVSKNFFNFNFYYSEYGKPYLTNDLESGPIQFNVSNSFEYLVIGISFRNQIGIDIEKIRSSIDYNRLVNRFFSERENIYFFSLDAKEREEIFFQWWTVKESVVKNLGIGMRLPPNKFDIPLDNDTNKILIQYKDINTELFYYNFLLSDDSKSSLCVQKEAKRIKFFKI